MTVTIRQGDCREVLATLPDESVHCVVTSPPYFGLRDYNATGQIGLELTPAEYLAELVRVFHEARRVLRADGTAWVNMGDSYANDGKWGGATGGKHTEYLHGGETRIGREKRITGLKPKDLIGIPWALAFALRADGWYLRQDIIWSKPNPMPESVRDRCTKAHEYLFLLSKSERYYYDQEAIREDCPPLTAAAGGWQGRAMRGQKFEAKSVHENHSDIQNRVYEPDGKRNKRSVWDVASQPFGEAHFATFPPTLIEPCIKAGTSEYGCCATCKAPYVRVYKDIRWEPTCGCKQYPLVSPVVLDPFGGAGTTGLVADRLGRNAILIELNPEYAAMAERRIKGDAGMFADVAQS